MKDIPFGKKVTFEIGNNKYSNKTNINQEKRIGNDKYSNKTNTNQEKKIEIEWINQIGFHLSKKIEIEINNISDKIIIDKEEIKNNTNDDIIIDKEGTNDKKRKNIFDNDIPNKIIKK